MFGPAHQKSCALITLLEHRTLYHISIKISRANTEKWFLRSLYFLHNTTQFFSHDWLIYRRNFPHYVKHTDAAVSHMYRDEVPLFLWLHWPFSQSVNNDNSFKPFQATSSRSPGKRISWHNIISMRRAFAIGEVTNCTTPFTTLLDDCTSLTLTYRLNLPLVPPAHLRYALVSEDPWPWNLYSKIHKKLTRINHSIPLPRPTSRELGCQSEHQSRAGRSCIGSLTAQLLWLNFVLLTFGH